MAAQRQGHERRVGGAAAVSFGDGGASQEIAELREAMSVTETALADSEAALDEERSTGEEMASQVADLEDRLGELEAREQELDDLADELERKERALDRREGQEGEGEEAGSEPESESAPTSPTEPDSDIPEAADCPRSPGDRQGSAEEAALCLLAAHRAGDRDLADVYAHHVAVDELFAHPYEPPDPDWDGCSPAVDFRGYECSFWFVGLDAEGEPDETIHGTTLSMEALEVPETSQYIIYEMHWYG